MSEIICGSIEVLKAPEPCAEFIMAGVHYNIYSEELIPNRWCRFWQKKILGIEWRIYEK